MIYLITATVSLFSHSLSFESIEQFAIQFFKDVIYTIIIVILIIIYIHFKWELIKEQKHIRNVDWGELLKDRTFIIYMIFVVLFSITIRFGLYFYGDTIFSNIYLNALMEIFVGLIFLLFAAIIVCCIWVTFFYHY